MLLPTCQQLTIQQYSRHVHVTTLAQDKLESRELELLKST